MENISFSSSNDPYNSKRDTYVAILLLGLCVGLPWLIGVLISFCCKGSEPRKLTVFNVSLVFTALLQSLSTPVMVMWLMGVPCDDGYYWLEHCDIFFSLWHGSRHCGVFLHLLVVLEFTVANLRYGSKLQSVYVSLPIVLTWVVGCMVFSRRGDDWIIGLGAAASAMAVVTCATAALSWCTRRPPIKNRDVQVIASAVFAFATYLPSFVMACMVRDGIPDMVAHHRYSIMVYLCNIRLVADAHLCWLVTRESTAPPLQADALVVLENMAEGQMIRATDQTIGVPGLSLGEDVCVPTAPPSVQQHGAAGDPPPNYVDALQSKRL